MEELQEVATDRWVWDELVDGLCSNGGVNKLKDIAPMYICMVVVDALLPR